jgi:C4-dicarboxylate-specific signal transduction histidine kinase
VILFWQRTVTDEEDIAEIAELIERIAQLERQLKRARRRLAELTGS